MSVNQLSQDFGLLVRQNQTSEDITYGVIGYSLITLWRDKLWRVHFDFFFFFWTLKSEIRLHDARGYSTLGH